MKAHSLAAALVLILLAAGLLAEGQQQSGLELGGRAGPLVAKPGSDGFKVTGRLEPSQQAPGHSVVAVVTFSCPPGWYVFADSVSAQVVGAPGTVPPVRSGALYLPVAKSKHDELLEQQVSYLDGQFEVKLVLEVGKDAAPGDYQLDLVAGFQGCSPTLCFQPEDRGLPVRLSVLGPDAQPLPVALPHQQPAGSEGPAGTEAAAWYEKQLTEHGLLFAVALAFLAGLGLFLTPCVYPMIPVTMGVIGATATGRKLNALGRSLTYVLGISLAYSALGIIAARTGQAFGTLLQHPAVYLALGAVFAVLAGAMFGLYTIELPGSWAARLQARLRGRAGLAGVLVLGILSGVAVSSCTAPVVFAAMGYVVRTRNMLAGFLIFFAIAWGMGTPLVVLGTFSGLLRALPRSGEWHVAVQRIFGLALLAGASYFVWLSGVLPDPWFYVLLGVALVVLSVFVGAFDRLDPSSGWWPRLRKAAGLLALVGAVACFLQPLRAARPAPETIAWLTSQPDAMEAAADGGRPVMLYFWQERCPVCRELEGSVFPDPRVVAESRRYVAVKFDGTHARSAQVRAILDKYGVLGFPTLVFVGADGKVLHERTVVGHVDADRLSALMRAVREGRAGD